MWCGIRHQPSMLNKRITQAWSSIFKNQCLIECTDVSLFFKSLCSVYSLYSYAIVLFDFSSFNISSVGKYCNELSGSDLTPYTGSHQINHAMFDQGHLAKRQVQLKSEKKMTSTIQERETKQHIN